MALPKWLREGITPQEKGRRFEKREAKKAGVKIQPGSGNTPHYKEDFQAGEYLVQCKWGGKKQMTVHKKDLVQLKVNSAKIGKDPLFLFSVDNEVWAAVPVDEAKFKELSGDGFSR